MEKKIGNQLLFLTRKIGIDGAGRIGPSSIFYYLHCWEQKKHLDDQRILQKSEQNSTHLASPGIFHAIMLEFVTGVNPEP